MTRRRAFLLGLNAFVLVALCYGPLFVWSPLTPGFVRAKVGPLTYVHRVDRPLIPPHAAVANDLSSLEATLGLRFEDDVTIVLCDEPGDFRRFTPWLPQPASLGARTLQFGTVIYVAPAVRNREDVGAFIRHELVHVLLLRNTSLTSRTELSRHWWLVEGLSVYYGNPESYLYPDSHRAAVLASELAQLLDPDERGDRARATVTERYAIAGAFVRHLIEKHPAHTWQRFLREYVSAPASWRATFSGHFGETFATALENFRTRLTRTTTIQLPIRRLPK